MPSTDRTALSATRLDPTYDRLPALDGLLATPQARELAAALGACDPMRGAFDVAVRRFVRLERDAHRDLETILAELAAVIGAHVEPALAPERRPALRQAAAWFAVSEYHRAD